MEMLLPYLAQLGLGGILAIVLLGLAQLALVEFARAVLHRWGLAVQGGAVLLLSLALGGLLGWLMLSRVAGVAGIDLPPPWGGVALGLVLAATVSGLVAYQQRRRAEKAAGQVTPDILADVLAQVAAGQARTPSVTVQVPAPAAPQVPAPVPCSDDLRPITPEETAAMTRTDWPAVAGLDDPPQYR
ncbi:hypothetical protein Dcar01_02413 [Deinococcus carri]|uniref:Uncharacterized protein n=1 Tax=Deinococcus carri TaxID=1211323 RepID=A0ABP9W8K5_9DEIO